MRSWSSAMGALIATALAGNAFAQQAPRFQLSPIHPASPQSPFFVVEGPTRPQHQGWQRVAATFGFGYARTPLTVHATRNGSDQQLGKPVEDSLLAHLGAGVQLARTLSFDLHAPIALYQRGSDTVVGSNVIPAPASSTALGDLRAGLLFRSWLQPAFGLVIGLRTRMPTGNQDAYLSDGRWHPEALAGVFTESGALRTGCTAFVDFGFASSKQGDRLGGGCGADVRVAAPGTRVGLEFLGAALRTADDASAGALFEVWAALRQPVGPVVVGVAGGPGLGHSPGVAAFRALASLSYSPQRSLASEPPPATDQDLDGVVDALDACPKEAGPRSEDARRSGCPNLDSDGDTVPDHLDACPKKPGAPRQDHAVSGCPDTDNDGTVDKLDKCPSEPAEAGDDPETLGCPKRARLRADRFVIQPPLVPLGSPSDLSALREIAFTLRASSALRAVTVTVVLQGVESDEQLADRAQERAAQLVQQLIDLGVDRRRLVPAGGVSPDPPQVTLVVTDRASP